ncbi:MAG: hypothetical protein OEV59_01355 [Deltaproteobacteria bacterium]|nr:hypothetical protein [Deltaproteobacteria bacterium]
MSRAFIQCNIAAVVVKKGVGETGCGAKLDVISCVGYAAFALIF